MVLADERRSRLLDFLSLHGTASLADIVALTGASESTARRDLKRLVEAGLVEGVRGGARARRQDFLSYREARLADHLRLHAEEKRRIAVAAARLLEDRHSCFMSSGSTTFALAQEVYRRKPNIAVATNTLRIADLLAEVSSVMVHVIGGLYPLSEFGTIGPEAVASVGRLHMDIAFLSCDAVDSDGVRSASVFEAELEREMAAHADRTVVVADASKLGASAPNRLLTWSQVNDFVTDSEPEGLGGTLREANVSIVLPDNESDLFDDSGLNYQSRLAHS
jgi:DeoR/GlpR family transcriptional regulator of sugar metabolism